MTTLGDSATPPTAPSQYPLLDPPPPAGPSMRPPMHLRQPSKKVRWARKGGKALALAYPVFLIVIVGVVIQEAVADRAASKAPDEWPAELVPYVDFVETARGLDFEQPVEVAWIDVEASLESANDEWASSLSDEDRAWYDDWSTVYALLGLIEPGTNLLQREAEAQVAGAYAYYDSYENVIYLPEGEVGLEIEVTIVHELTHALQDQHGLFDYEPWTDDESNMVQALYEGDANRIEYLWIDSLSPAQSGAYDDLVVAGNAEDEEAIDDSDFFATAFAAPYFLGEPSVEILVEVYGQQEIDRLLRDGPGSSERLVDPLSPTPEPAPAKERFVAGDFSLEGTMGPVMLFQVLAPGVGSEQALLAVQGFDGDAFGLSTDGGRQCLHIVVWVDESVDGTELAAAALNAGFDTSIANRGKPEALSVELTTCSPVGDPANQGFHTIAPLMISNWMTAYHVGNGVDVETARCAAFTQAAAAGDLNRGELIDWDALRQASSDYLQAC